METKKADFEDVYVSVPARAALTLLEPFSCKGIDGMLRKQKEQSSITKDFGAVKDVLLKQSFIINHAS